MFHGVSGTNKSKYHVPEMPCYQDVAAVGITAPNVLVAFWFLFCAATGRYERILQFGDS